MRTLRRLGLSLTLLAALAATPARAEPLNSLEGFGAVLAATEARDWSAAERAAGSAGPLGRAVLAWTALRAGRGDWAAYRDFAAAHADWPGMDLLYRRGEDRIAAATPQEVRDWFATHPPQTAGGAMALVAALAQLGETELAAAEAARAWTAIPMTAAEEAAFLQAHGPLVEELHEARVTALLDAQEWQAAQLGLERLSADAAALAAARIAVQSGAAGVDALILALPPERQRDPGLAMDRFRWRVQAKLPDLARELMELQSGSAEDLRRPEIWASARRDYARASLRAGDWSAAERLAAAHHLEPGSEAWSDLEFLAGYAALRGGAPDRALLHFQRLETGVNSVISVARAFYWQGRAHEAAGDAAAAQTAFETAARHQSAYYGQLAAERLGHLTDPALAVPGRAEAALPQWRRSALRENELFQVGVFAFASGRPDLGQRFFLHLAETADPEDIGRMARLALELHHPYHALRLAKRAASRGAVWPAAYFPLTGLESEDLDLPPELVMAIARQESEFNHRVSSHAGALGLMQVMPGTAQDMARRLGVDYDRGRLTEDWVYNARLGAAYLDGLRRSFGPSSALVAAGYNAGPGRSRQWTERFGDIRQGADPVDWVEMIPFDETRNYVMRVTEALAVYRARIAGHPVPITPSLDLTGGGEVPAPPRPRQTLAEVLTQSLRPPREGDALSPAAAAFAETEPDTLPAPSGPAAAAPGEDRLTPAADADRQRPVARPSL